MNPTAGGPGRPGVGYEQGDQRGMNGFWGADTEALRTMSAVLVRRAQVLGELEGTLASTIDSLEWVGEDAEHFRAEWTRVVRPGLQDQEFELRLRARRLAQHADEQDGISVPDSWIFGGGSGGWSTPGEFLRDVLRSADGVLGDLLGGGSGQRPGLDGPLAELLREVLATPEGRAAFLGAFLGGVLGGLLADIVTRAIELGAAPEALLSGLGPGAGLSDLLGAAPQGAGEPSAPAAAQSGGSTAEAPGGTEDGIAGSAGAGAGAGAGGSAGGGGAGGGGDAGGAGAAGGPDGTVADSGAAATGETSGGAGARGPDAAAEGPAQSAGTSGSARFVRAEDEGPTTLLDRLLEMLGDVMGPGSGGASSVGEDIGASGLDGARR